MTIDEFGDDFDFDLTALDHDAIRFDALDKAIIGHDHRGLLAYSYKRMVELFVEDQGMSYDEAIEWVDYNVLQTNAGMGFTVVFDI